MTTSGRPVPWKHAVTSAALRLGSAHAPHARAARAAAPCDTSATRRMRTAAGSPASGAAACAFRNAHNASCSAVGPAPAASSARPAAPCGLASEAARRERRGTRWHLQFGVVDVETRRDAAWTEHAGAHLQRVLDDVHVGERAAVTEVRRLARGGARGCCTCGRRSDTAVELSAHGAPAAERQQRRCSGTRIDAPVERRHPKSCAASAGVTSPLAPDATTQSAMSPLRAKSALCTAAQGGTQCAAARAARPWSGSASKWLARTCVARASKRRVAESTQILNSKSNSAASGWSRSMRPRTSAP